VRYDSEDIFLSGISIKGVAEAINAVGAKVLYLPPYSPDLNPIEMMWSKIKAYLRKVKARTKELLEKEIANALNSVTKKDIVGWFRESKYSI